jgi:hypothetical protein
MMTYITYQYLFSGYMWKYVVIQEHNAFSTQCIHPICVMLNDAHSTSTGFMHHEKHIIYSPSSNLACTNSVNQHQYLPDWRSMHRTRSKLCACINRYMSKYTRSCMEHCCIVNVSYTSVNHLSCSSDACMMQLEAHTTTTRCMQCFIYLYS